VWGDTRLERVSGALSATDDASLVAVCRYLRGIETGVVAAPDSLLGLLQRGRGQGYINALAAGRASAEAAIVECVTHDPRIAHQVESRDEYYGRCAFELDAVVRLHTGYPP